MIKNLKKIKKYFKIIPFIFFIFLFFQIGQAKAACDWVYSANNDIFNQYNCESDGKYNAVDPQVKCGASKGSLYTCCCGTKSEAGIPETKSAPDTSLPQWTMPDPQIKIPGVVFTSIKEIQAACAKDGSGKLTSCIFPWIGEYIAGIYKYAIGIVGILAAVVLMIGGLLWIVAGGNATAIGEAKAWIVASLTGLVIALCSYVILYQVNPALVNFGGLKISLPDSIPVPVTAEEKAQFTANCKPTNSGDCAVSTMSMFGNRAEQASAICMAESSGKATANNPITKCSNGDYYAVWGLFQFNLSDNTFSDSSGKMLNCNLAFGVKPSGKRAWVNSDPTCTVTDPALYQQCVAAATDAQLSRINAQRLVTASSWGPWETNSKLCHF